MTTGDPDALVKAIDKPRVLIFAPHTRDTRTRSGIHRVAMRLMEHLPRYAHVDIIKWDDIDGQPRYCDRTDCQRYFGGPPPAGIEVHPLAHRIDYRFGETVPKHESVTVLMPEVFYLAADGNEIHARLIAQCLAEGWTTAALFYDLIPLKMPGYPEREAAARSLAELTRVDVVLPISRFSLQELNTYRETTLGLDLASLTRSGHRVVAVPLADRDKVTVLPSDPERRRDTILLLGTIEPRKQQVRVIRAFQKLRLSSRASLRLVLIGGMNPQSEEECRSLVAGDPAVTWLENASDAQVDVAFSSSRFSVFASREEGFGLPIVESVCRGVPCLTANHGAMREAAGGGGCLLTDVEDDKAIEAALETLAFDDRAIQRLCAEIGHRDWRSWDDYAADVMSAIDGYERPAHSARRAVDSVVERLFDSEIESWRHQEDGSLAGDEVTIVKVDADSMEASERGATYVAVIAPDTDPEALPQTTFDAIVGADAWFCHSSATYAAVTARAAASGTDGLLSGCSGWRTERGALAALITSELDALFERRRRRAVMASRDSVFRQAWKGTLAPGQKPILAIVISTYNGAAFIERNIAHTLQLISPLAGRVRLVVVDNASTDETPQRLEPFAAKGEIVYVRVGCNTGLLGNLRTISTLKLARHVWAIGVDDIILPGAIERILTVLEHDPSCPFILPNFSVYHRDGFQPQDTCADLISECRPVGIDCGPDETTLVHRAASYHDNVLTAFYIVVFRADLMSAVFNHPFTAPFFGSLIDTIPTTKIMLEVFSDFAAAWLKEPAIAGNACNTWRHHRVAWHGVLMPEALELARDAGIDRNLLRQWARAHVDLLKEANSLYPNPNVSADFSERDLEPSFRVFGANMFPHEASVPA